MNDHDGLATAFQRGSARGRLVKGFGAAALGQIIKPPRVPIAWET